MRGVPFVASELDPHAVMECHAGVSVEGKSVEFELAALRTFILLLAVVWGCCCWSGGRIRCDACRGDVVQPNCHVGRGHIHQFLVTVVNHGVEWPDRVCRDAYHNPSPSAPGSPVEHWGVEWDNVVRACGHAGIRAYLLGDCDWSGGHGCCRLCRCSYRSRCACDNFKRRRGWGVGRVLCGLL